MEAIIALAKTDGDASRVMLLQDAEGDCVPSEYDDGILKFPT